MDLSNTFSPTTSSANSNEADAVGLLAKLLAVLMTLCIGATIVGNILVVLSVFTYRPLQAVQNFYIVSLAVADLAVAVLVMPFNAAYSTADGRWYFGWFWCHVWLTCDILTCTASILNLCAIAVDRYFAVHDPISYGRQRTVGRVLIVVAVVWVASAIISIPPLPLFGSTGTGNTTNTSSSSSTLYNDVEQTCQLSDQPTYVVYSASGSFFIPLVIMIFVYVNIYAATRARLRARAAADGRLAAAIVTTTAAPLPAEIALKTAAMIHERSEGKGEFQTESEKRHELEVSSLRDDVKDRKAACVSVTGNTFEAAQKEEDQLSAPNTKQALTTRETEVAKCTAPAVSGDVIVVVGERRRGRFLTTRFRSILRRFNVDEENDDNDSEDTIASRRAKETTSSSPRTDSSRMAASYGTAGQQRICQFLEEKQRVTLARERRAARTMGIVMGAFVLCWLPFFIYYVVSAFYPEVKPKSTTGNIIYNFIVWLGYINSTLNPLIYTVFNVDFRRAFALLLRCRCFRRRRSFK